MFQTDQPTASNTLPTPATPGAQGFFTNGNPASGVAATIVDADFLNMVQQELINVVAAGGLTPSKTTYTQVRDAIKRIGQNTIVLADTGAVNAYTAVNTTPLVAATWIDGVIQQVKIAHANTGASTYAPDGLTAIPIYGLGLQPLQGGELALNGTAVLMHATIAGVNSGNPIAVLMECAGGAQQIAPATQSQHAVQMAQAAGVVGSTRNLVMNVTAASATATLTADEIIVETALGGVRYCLPSFNKTINLATTGAGGMDTGTAPVSGYVALYAIYNPTTQTAALLAKNATSAVQPNVYGGANMPAGYTASALVSVWPTNASSQFAIGVQVDREVGIANNTVLSTSTVQASLTSFSVSGAIPLNARTCRGDFTVSSSTASAGSNGVVCGTPIEVGRAAQSATSATASAATTMTFPHIPILTPQTLYYRASVSAGTLSFLVNLVAYTI